MKIQANGISMNYELNGSGRYFTLIHGAGDNLNAWYNQVPVFSRHYHLLTYDVRGHGQTELPEGELTMELWIEDLYALLKALNIDETILLGFSMGGAIAIRFTLEHPEMIKALILSNSGGLMAPVRRSEEEIRQMESRRQAQLENIKKEGMEAVVRDRISRTFSPGFAEKNPKAVEKYKSVLMQNKPEGYLRVMQRMGGAATPPDLSKVGCPTLIISGENDALGGQSGRAAQEAISGSQLMTFPTGHYTLLEEPEEYNKAVLGFLNEVGLR
ncbi:MAG: alpha/beta fold hydrolase [Dehalococcoidales bacterium]|nr:MAG: alpha/beta fold hydrolase [Dehalococcoidales bacterium]